MEYVFDAIVYASTVVLPFWAIWKSYDAIMGMVQAWIDSRKPKEEVELTFELHEPEVEDVVQENYQTFRRV